MFTAVCHVHMMEDRNQNLQKKQKLQGWKQCVVQLLWGPSCSDLLWQRAQGNRYSTQTIFRLDLSTGRIQYMAEGLSKLI